MSRGLAEVLGAVIVASCLVVGACALPDDTPSEPDPVLSTPPAPTGDNPNPPPVMGAPAPKATPTPQPSPGATPDPGAPPEGAGACGAPIPPPLSRINAKIHARGGDTWMLDSTPLVGPDVVYCTKIGFPDRATCPVRPEGHPEREACELYVTGRAIDTGRPGPTWYNGANLCTGRPSGCANHSENQYLLLVYSGGKYRACGRNGVCGEVNVDK